MLTERKIRILHKVIDTFIRDAEPVGSQAIVERTKLSVSPATVRNDMVELEEDGYLYQPHTSAGRVPTERAWKYYLEHFLSDKPISPERQEALKRIFSSFRYSRQDLLKHLAQTLAEFTAQAALIAFNRHDTYYTGISKLFSQPEFDEIDVIRAISRIVDHLDEVMPEFFSKLEGDVTILIGRDNPLGEFCGLILAPIPRQPGLFGILGPIRQDYSDHVPLIRFTHKLLDSA